MIILEFLVGNNDAQRSSVLEDITRELRRKLREAAEKNPAEGLLEFEKALGIAPESPTLWKNYSVSLWANARYEDSIEANIRTQQGDAIKIGVVLLWIWWLLWDIGRYGSLYSTGTSTCVNVSLQHYPVQI